MGKLITFEGIDGSGKSTALQTVSKQMDAPHWVTAEETDHWTGECVRRAISEHAPPLQTLFLFLADRAHHAPQIEAKLQAGHVLCDRYAESTLAYQSVTVGDVGWLQGLHRGPVASHVLLFDLPADVAVARATARGDTTPYEKVEFLEQVRQAYLGLAEAEPERFTVIDATGSQDEVAAAALAAVQSALA